MQRWSLRNDVRHVHVPDWCVLYQLTCRLSTRLSSRVCETLSWKLLHRILFCFFIQVNWFFFFYPNGKSTTSIVCHKVCDETAPKIRTVSQLNMRSSVNSFSKDFHQNYQHFLDLEVSLITLRNKISLSLILVAK